MKTFHLPPRVLQFSKAIADIGGTTYVAGGCVRDQLLGIESKDIDLEIHGISPEQMERVLKKFPPYKAVGKAFGVWKILPASPTELEIDVALPQLNGETAPFIGCIEACKRRDLTINAMLWNVNSESLEDPFGGEQDLQERILKATHPIHFMEDPLRVFRVAQFAGRLQCSVDHSLQEICLNLTSQPNFSELPKERVLVELEKGWFKSIDPGIATQWMVQLKALQGYRSCFQKISAESWEQTHQRISYAVKYRNAFNIGASMSLFWGLLTYELPKADVNALFENLNIERFQGFPVRKSFEELRHHIQQVSTEHSRFVQNQSGEHLYPPLIYAMADCIALGQNDVVTQNYNDCKKRGLLTEPLPRIIRGSDLLALNIQGPQLGIWIQRLRIEQLHERVNNTEEALLWIKENL